VAGTKAGSPQSLPILRDQRIATPRDLLTLSLVLQPLIRCLHDGHALQPHLIVLDHGGLRIDARL
jgi:hypothetical protein